MSTNDVAEGCFKGGGSLKSDVTFKGGSSKSDLRWQGGSQKSQNRGDVLYGQPQIEKFGLYPSPSHPPHDVSLNLFLYQSDLYFCHFSCFFCKQAWSFLKVTRKAKNLCKWQLTCFDYLHIIIWKVFQQKFHLNVDLLPVLLLLLCTLYLCIAEALGIWSPFSSQCTL